MSIKSTVHVTRTTAMDRLAEHYARLITRLHTKSNEELGDLLDKLADDADSDVSIFHNFRVENNGAER